MIKSEIPLDWISKTDLCRLLDMSKKGFDYWGVHAAGMVGQRTFYTLKDVIKNRVDNAKMPKNAGADKPENENIAYEKYRLTKAQADAQELKNDIALSKVIPTDFACFALSGVVAQAVGILESLPLNLKRLHPDLSALHQATIERELAKAMNALSSLDENLPEMIEDYGSEATKAL